MSEYGPMETALENLGRAPLEQDETIADLKAQLEAAERERDEYKHKEEIWGGFFDEAAAPAMGWRNFRSHEQLRNDLTQAEALLRQARDAMLTPTGVALHSALTAINAFLTPKENAG